MTLKHFLISNAAILSIVCGVITPVSARAGDGAAPLTLEQARTMAYTAERKAVDNHTAVVVTVLDDGGHTIIMERMADAQLASLALSERKARSAVYYKRPSSVFEQALKGGKMAVLALPDAMPAAGGIPILRGNVLLGAIGVSGGSNDQDEQAAEAGITAFSGSDRPEKTNN